jgi:hypothetical protein
MRPGRGSGDTARMQQPRFTRIWYDGMMQIG